MTAPALLRERNVREAYKSGSTMARTLETLVPGTPVFAGETNVGSVVAAYADGDARIAEIIVVHWTERGEDVAVPSTEVLSVDDSGVHLMGTVAGPYSDLAPFDAASFTTMRKLT
jgi:hypothetical protein